MSASHLSRESLSLMEGWELKHGKAVQGSRSPLLLRSVPIATFLQENILCSREKLVRWQVGHVPLSCHEEWGVESVASKAEGRRSRPLLTARVHWSCASNTWRFLFLEDRAKHNKPGTCKMYLCKYLSRARQCPAFPQELPEWWSNSTPANLPALTVWTIFCC